jgi:hypothetical protein
VRLLIFACYGNKEGRQAVRTDERGMRSGIDDTKMDSVGWEKIHA